MAREHETERRHQPETPAVETPAVEVAQAAAQAAGPVPAPAVAAPAGHGGRTASEQAYETPEIDPTAKAMGEAMVKRMNQANGLDGGKYDLEHGIHYSYNFESECQRAGKPELWKDEYRYGYNASGHWQNPSETGGFMDFRLKKGHSASKAIQAWLGGLTVAECLTSVIAMQFDTVRRAVGDHKFDKMFGSENAAEDKAVSSSDRLRISTSGTPMDNLTARTELAKLGGSRDAEVGKVTDEEKDKLLKPGEWYYFYNHPKYLLKHPGGAWQGENSLYMGKNGAGERLWAGLGASNKTEDEMISEMVMAYNGRRDKEDEREMKERRIKNDDGSYADSKYDPKGGEFKETVTREDILNDPAYSIDGVKRKGGFLPVAGITFDFDAVKRERDNP
jgi:hypothetical protein